MDLALISLIAASTAFVGTHFAMSHPLRAPLVRALGPGGFMGVYSLVSAACMVWMYFAFAAAGAGTPPLWSGFGDFAWMAASFLTLLALILFAGSLIGNPALPAPGAEDAARADVSGVFKVTRHPMMWGFALWGASHMIAAPTARTLIVASAIIFLALVGAYMQDRKKRVLMGDAWAQWQVKTTYWPRWERILQVGVFPLVGGTALWLALTYIHIPLGGWEAGIWRWV